MKRSTQSLEVQKTGVQTGLGEERAGSGCMLGLCEGDDGTKPEERDESHCSDEPTHNMRKAQGRTGGGVDGGRSPALKGPVNVANAAIMSDAVGHLHK